MKRCELLEQIRGQLNGLAEELVRADLLEPAQFVIAASMNCGEAEGKLIAEDAQDVKTEAAEPAQGS